MWWTLGAVATIVLVAVLAFGIWLFDSLKRSQEEVSPMPSDRSQVASSNPSSTANANETLIRFQGALAWTADKIVALQPGLTWRWNRDNTTVSCLDQPPAPPRVQVLTRNVVFDGPIHDVEWPAALDVVRRQASVLGAAVVFVYNDRPGNHDVAFTSETGVEVRFGTRINAVLSARSDCVPEGSNH